MPEFIPQAVFVNTRMPQELRDRVLAEAEAAGGRSLGSIVREALEEWLAKRHLSTERKPPSGRVGA